MLATSISWAQYGLYIQDKFVGTQRRVSRTDMLLCICTRLIDCTFVVSRSQLSWGSRQYVVLDEYPPARPQSWIVRALHPIPLSSVEVYSHNRMLRHKRTQSYFLYFHYLLCIAERVRKQPKM